MSHNVNDIDPKLIEIRVVFLRIGEIDTLNEKFYAEVLIESRWKEEKLKCEFHDNNNDNDYDGDDEYNDKELKQVSKYWNPKIYVKNFLNAQNRSIHYNMRRECVLNNADDNDSNDSARKSHTRRNYTYWLFEYQILKGYFFEKLELDYFPVDVQDLSVVITTPRSDREVRFMEMKDRISSVRNCTLDKHIWQLYHHVEVRIEFDTEYGGFDLYDNTKNRHFHKANRIRNHKKQNTVGDYYAEQNDLLYNNPQLDDNNNSKENNRNGMKNVGTFNKCSYSSVIKTPITTNNTTSKQDMNTEPTGTAVAASFNTPNVHMKKKSLNETQSPKTRTCHMKFLDVLRFEDDFNLKVFNKKIKQPLILFQCRAARKAGYYYWNAYLLIFLITSVVFTTFSINVEQPFYRLPTSATLLLTSITFRWIYSGRCLPTVNYLTSLDKYSLNSLTFIYISLLWHGVAPFCLKLLSVDLNLMIKIDLYVLAVLLMLYLIVHMILFYWLNKAHKIRRYMMEKDMNHYRNLVELHDNSTMIDNIIEENYHQIPKNNKKSARPTASQPNDEDENLKINKNKARKYSLGARLSILINPSRKNLLEKV